MSSDRDRVREAEETRPPTEGEAVDAESCPECDGDVISDDSERVCEECGLVVDSDEIDLGPDWRRIDGDVQGFQRAGGPSVSPVQDDKGLGSMVGSGKAADASGANRNDKLQVLQCENKRSKHDDVSKTLRHGLFEIRRLVAALELPQSVRGRASVLYRKLRESDLLMGSSVEAGAAASIYVAVREEHTITRSFAAIIREAQTDRREIQSQYRRMKKADDLEVGGLPPTPSEMVASIASEADLPREVERQAREYTAVAEAEALHAGRDPKVVAAACLYIATRGEAPLSQTQADIAEAADVTPQALRSNRNRIVDVVDVDRGGSGGE